jgi:hypothetical protein
MPKQSDDLTQEGDKSQRTPKAKLKIPVPTRGEISSALQKASQKQEPEASEKPPAQPAP